MAEVLPTFDFNERGRSKYLKYLDGQIWKITSDDRGGTKPGTAIDTLRWYCRRRGKKPQIQLLADGSIVFQAINK